MALMLIRLFFIGILFVPPLFVLPALVLEKQDISGALAGSVPLLKKTWAEITVCILIFSLLLLAVSLPDPVFRMIPALVGYDYHFFYLHGAEMAVACSLFLAGWWIASAVCLTAAGIAARDLYLYATSGREPAPCDTGQKVIPV